jgi:hypothetical protein
MFTQKIKSILVSLVFLSSLSFNSAAVVKTDIVFMIDATGSMAGEIAGVKNGFANFIGGLNAATVDARFAVVLFGGGAELVLDFTSDAGAAQNAFNNIVIGSRAGFQNNHNLNPEAGLEAIRMALGAAPNSEFANNNIAGDGFLDFRNDARKNLILVTDEDSDRPFHAANRFSGQTSNEPPSTFNANWQAEVDATAQAVINNGAFLNMLINRNDTPTRSQYGDYAHDVSDANLLNFDAAATLANLQADGATVNSLQAQVLDAGLISRSFNVAGANDANFVNNFFDAKIEEIVNDPGVNVPEPSIIALFAVGLFGIGFARRRQA